MNMSTDRTTDVIIGNIITITQIGETSMTDHLMLQIKVTITAMEEKVGTKESKSKNINDLLMFKV